MSGDKNFRPINLRWGPNGEIYVIDWHDQNPCHQAVPEDLDYEHGRVYRIPAEGGWRRKKAEDLGKKERKELIENTRLGMIQIHIVQREPHLRLLHEHNPKKTGTGQCD